MQIDTSNTVQVSSNLPAAAGTMSLDQDGMAHLIQVLTNLYADKHLAVLREYSTNARDAHIAAGRADLPIQVSLPTTLNPTLVISDNGVGLSKDELLGIYSRYGASTKRNTDTQVGSFGLGSKSAFTIGGQFIVTARKDGVQTSAVFAMNEHGIGTVNILAEHETQEGNGVTVSIATQDPEKMQDAAAKFFRAWLPGTVLVDGEEPESYYSDPDAMWLSTDILYTRKGGITVSMGSVAYPLPYSAAATVRSRIPGARWSATDAGLLVVVPIGAVDITPSREGIRDTERSITAITAVLSRLESSMQARLQAAMTQSTDTMNQIFAARPLLLAAERLGIRTASALPAKISLPPGSATVYSLSSRGGLRSDDLSSLHAETAHLYTVLVGTPAGRSCKRHAKAWLEENSNRRQLISFRDSEAVAGQTEWFRYGTDVNGTTSPVEMVHFDDIELPAKERSAQERSAITYNTSQGYLTPSEIKAQPLPVAYGGHSGHPALSGHLVVSLTNRQSEDVFLRRVPQAVPAEPVVKAYVDAKVRQLGDISELSKARHMQRYLERVSYALGARHKEITHPAYLAARVTVQAYQALDAESQSLIRQRSTVEESDATKALDAALPLLRVAFQGYGGLSDQAIAHLVQYCNAQAASA